MPSLPTSPTSSPWIKKPLSVVHRQEPRPEIGNNGDEHIHVQRHLSVTDLIFIGVGGTVGSGIFVLTGQIAAEYAGPSTFLSFAVSGLAALCSGVCYAELSARIPAEGSTYVYCYVCLGEVAAVMAASCLTLEYGVAGAAVARSWGDKMLEWLHELGLSTGWLEPFGMNIPGFLVSAGSTLLLLAGVQESKTVTNWITSFKMLVIVFMTVAGFLLFQKKNMFPLAPKGLDGILRGATSSFFGYLGYDEVCCVAGEAKHPARDLPRAVLGTLIIVSVSYILSALALTGMVSYVDISATSGFPGAFRTRHIEWAAQVTAIGEILTLPVVVLVSLMAQPRVAVSMAEDGLLPPIFKQLDSKGNLYGGTLVSGIAMTAIATFVPFTYLNDLISAGILFAFSMTNSCLILLRSQSTGWTLEFYLLVYNILCFLTAVLLSNDFDFIPFQPFVSVMCILLTIAWMISMARECPPQFRFGGNILQRHETHYTHDHVEGIPDEEFFRTPLVPYLPCLGMFVNWYLIAQLSVSGIMLLVVYLGCVVLVYHFSCGPNSHGHLDNWGHRPIYETVESTEDEINPNIRRANSFS